MRIRGPATLLATLLGTTLLAGCISFGAEPPERLLTLTAERTAPAGSSASGRAETSLAVVEPAASQRLNVTRVPVMTSGHSLAYLVDAQWVERPARLFQRVLVETIRARGNRLVVAEGELDYAARTQLTGELLAMDYDAATASVVVRYDAILQRPDGPVLTRRFESVQPGIAADVLAVGPALNRAANDVAGQVAEWVG